MEITTFNDYFLSLTSLSLLVILVFQFINDKLLKYSMNGTWTQVTTWGLSILFAVFGWWQELGIFQALSFYWALGYGLACGALANGLFELNVIKAILEFFKLMANKPKE